MAQTQMMGYRVILLAIGAIVLTGCGTHAAKSPSPSPKRSSTSSQTIVEGDAQYAGTTNLKKWEQQANTHPNSWTDQVQAGRAAYSNDKPSFAIKYYQQAIKANPKQGLAYNNLGNVYDHLLHNYSMAAKYYQKATIIAPSYDYGWFNYSYAETQLGNKAKSKQIANKALTVLPKTDPLYKYIQLLSQGKL